MTLPFIAVPAHSDGLPRTHLVACSPAVPGHRPDQLPATTWCATPVTTAAAAAPADAQCRSCLHHTPAHMSLPGFGVPA